MPQSLQTRQRILLALRSQPFNAVPHSPLRRQDGLALTFDGLRPTLFGTDSLVLAVGISLLAVRATWTRTIALHVLRSAHVLKLE